jgi:hypothetical protein
MSVVVSVLLPLVSIAVGAGLTYWLNVRARRASQAEDLINNAIGAVAVEEASRQAITRVVSDTLPAEEHTALQIAVLKAAIENHNLKNVAAREALARVTILDRSVQRYYVDVEGFEERTQEIVDHLVRLRSDLRTRRAGRRQGAG